jgi:hypothetical protein
MFDFFGEHLVPKLDDSVMMVTGLPGMAGPHLDDADRTAGHALALGCKAYIQEARMGQVRLLLERFTARLALVYGDSFGAAIDMLRQLDFDDRPRAALTKDDHLMLMRDNRLIRHLLDFSRSPECLAARRWLSAPASRDH